MNISTSQSAQPAGRRSLAIAVVSVVWAYAVVLAVFAVIYQRLTGDTWWATALAYLPRWPLAGPLVVLLPCLLVRRYRRLTAAGLVVAGVLLLVPIGGFELPGLSYRPGSERDLRVITANVAGKSTAPEQVIALADDLEADIMVMQECLLPFPEPPPSGWHIHKGYQLCVISRHPIIAIDSRSPKEFWAVGGSGLMDRYDIDTPFGLVNVVNLHLETTRDALEALIADRWGGRDAARANLALRAREAKTAHEFSGRGQGLLIVAGDFNTVQESALFRRYWGHLQDAFDEVGVGFGNTKYTRWHGVRIDHVLLDPAWIPRRAFVLDRPLGKDHHPLVVDLVAPPGASR